jgi:hypothetical protein
MNMKSNIPTVTRLPENLYKIHMKKLTVLLILILSAVTGFSQTGEVRLKQLERSGTKWQIIAAKDSLADIDKPYFPAYMNPLDLLDSVGFSGGASITTYDLVDNEGWPAYRIIEGSDTFFLNLPFDKYCSDAYVITIGQIECYEWNPITEAFDISVGPNFDPNTNNELNKYSEQSTAPTTGFVGLPKVGDLWLNTDDLELYIYTNGGEWGTWNPLYQGISGFKSGDNVTIATEYSDASYTFSIEDGDSDPTNELFDSTTVYQTIIDTAIQIRNDMITDHGALTGLSDDDHPQYNLKFWETPMEPSLGGSDIGDYWADPVMNFPPIFKVWSGLGWYDIWQEISANKVGENVTLTLSENDDTAVFSVADNDSDPTNELFDSTTVYQTIIDTALQIRNDFPVIVADYDSIYLTGDTLYNQDGIGVDLSSYLDNTDTQLTKEQVQDSAFIDLASSGGIGYLDANNRIEIQISPINSATPSGSDLFLFESGFDLKKVTFDDLKTEFADGTGEWQDNGNYISPVSGANVNVMDDGKVGIGTTSPLQKLTVGNAINGVPTNSKIWIEGAGGLHATTTQSRISLGLDNNQDYGAYLGEINPDWSTGQTAVLGTRAGGVDYPALYARAGNVGIGTTLPSNILDIETSTAGQGAEIGNAFMGTWLNGATWAAWSHKDISNLTTGYALVQNSSGGTYFNAASGQPLNFRIGNTEKMLIQSTGRLKLGDYTPQAFTGTHTDLLATTDQGVVVQLNETSAARFVNMKYNYELRDSIANGVIQVTGTQAESLPVDSLISYLSQDTIDNVNVIPSSYGIVHIPSYFDTIISIFDLSIDYTEVGFSCNYDTWVDVRKRWKNEATRDLYVDGFLGDDNNSGESWAMAKKTLGSAVDSTISEVCNIFITGYVEHFSGDNINNSFNLIGVNQNWVHGHVKVDSWNKKDTTVSKLYRGVKDGTVDKIYDFATLINDKPFRYNLASSYQGMVDSIGYYYVVNDTITIHTITNSTDDLKAFDDYICDLLNTGGGNTGYFENVNFLLSLRSTSNEVTRDTLIVNSCTFFDGFETGDVIMTNGSVSMVYNTDFIGYHGDADVLNYHDSPLNTLEPFFLELDNRVTSYNGNDATVDQSTTNHDAGIGIRINGVYKNQFGPALYDVNSNSKSLVLGGEYIGSNTSNFVIGVGADASLYMDKVKITGIATDQVNIEGNLFLRNMKIPSYTGSGSIKLYGYEN